jgi:hypothetical protein
MIVSVLVLMALMMTLGLVISMLGAHWTQVVAALLGSDQIEGASAMRALARA